MCAYVINSNGSFNNLSFSQLSISKCWLLEDGGVILET